MSRFIRNFRSAIPEKFQPKWGKTFANYEQSAAILAGLVRCSAGQRCLAMSGCAVPCVAVVLVMPIEVVGEILLAAARLGLTDGQRAFIHLDTRRPLNASSDLAMSVPFVSPSAAANDSSAHRLSRAAEALMIIKSHATSVTNVSATSYKVCSLLAL